MAGKQQLPYSRLKKKPKCLRKGCDVIFTVHEHNNIPRSGDATLLNGGGHQRVVGFPLK